MRLITPANTKQPIECFTRNISPDEVEDMNTPQEVLVGEDFAAHEVRELQKKTKHRHRYICKNPASDGVKNVEIL